MLLRITKNILNLAKINKNFSSTTFLLFNGKKSVNPDANKSRINQLATLCVGIGIGGLCLSTLTGNKKKDEADKKSELDVNLNLDLNEIYEKCAIIFLSNSQVNFEIFILFQ